MLRRQAPRRAAPCQRRAARLPPQAPADWLRGSVRRLAPSLPPALRHGALRPGRRGQGLAAPQRATPCRAQAPPDASQPARRLRLAWVPFVAACAGPLAGSAVAQPAAPPHGAVLSRPQLSAASVEVRCGLPSQGRWSAMEHNAGNYAQHSASLRAVRLAPACCIMCQLPPLVFPRPPGGSLRVGLQALRFSWRGITFAPAFSLSS